MSVWKPDVCIYHGGCDDGFGAALAVHTRWGASSNTSRLVMEKAIARLHRKARADRRFSYKQDEMRRLAGRAASVVVLDHHKTAEAELFPWSIGGRRVRRRSTW